MGEKTTSVGPFTPPTSLYPFYPMRKPLILLVALFAGSQGPVPQSGAYHVIRRYALGGDGGCDYLTLDTASLRLYIARGTRVLVIDADSASLCGEIPNP